ncbi:hypothetical protein [Aestuariibaculum suncheonense]|uniref:Uncharacterized protein n=1 Tax=Aestuariibaculum suncheonense TaxID=1028745 RepID=A0A8J6Q6L6_9FLAO|nr:hypothetical protein [Aestuariibaculum suncheonense]MBD0835628.1 hypothetical protein [Aestuariibaculum suncheonense]
MKKVILFYIGLLILPVFLSCEEEDDVVMPKAYDTTWVDDAKLTFTPQGEKSFIYNINKSTGEEFWAFTEITYDVAFKSDESTASDISKIDFYLFAEEEKDGVYNYIGGNSGKLLTSVSNPSEIFQVSVTKDQLYELFENDFNTTRTDILPGDLFELKWVITGKDGNVFDSRENCIGFHCSYAFLAEAKVVDTWVGEFDYTWTEVGPGTVNYSYSKIKVGSTGIVKFVPGKSEGEYDCLDMSFGGAYGGARGGTLTYDKENKVLTIKSAESYYDSVWELVSVTENVLTIKWTNNFTTRYSEYGTIELRRTDGLKWPLGLSIIKL